MCEVPAKPFLPRGGRRLVPPLPTVVLWCCSVGYGRGFLYKPFCFFRLLIKRFKLQAKRSCINAKFQISARLEVPVPSPACLPPWRRGLRDWELGPPVPRCSKPLQ